MTSDQIEPVLLPRVEHDLSAGLVLGDRGSLCGDVVSVAGLDPESVHAEQPEHALQVDSGELAP
jgi:hypothetical protein